MTVTIPVPDSVPHEPGPEAQESATSVRDEVRAAASAASDVSTWMAERGAPDAWSGDAAEAAAHAMTRMSGDTGAATAALQLAGLALDTFLAAMTQRRQEHSDLMDRRQALNSDRDTLVQRIDTRAAPVETLQQHAAELRARFAGFHQDLMAWRDRVRADEDEVVWVLQSVDTVEEGDKVASLPGPDGDTLAAQLRAIGSDPGAVHAWWQGLTPAEREALLVNHPELVGNVNGIPAGDRDEANRASLQRDIDHLHALGNDRSPLQDRMLDNALAVQDAIGRAGLPPYADMDIDVNVLLYQPQDFGGDGTAAISYGDPDAADHTAVMVPGIMNDVAGLGALGSEALALHQETLNQAAPGTSVATIAWMGYDSPSWNPLASDHLLEAIAHGGASGLDVAHTVTEANAEAGGHALSAFVDGLRATDQGQQSHLTVIGHSYGSTTSAHAAADGLAADSLVLIGSPGAGGGVDHVSDLGLPTGQVHVGAADNDFVSWLGGQDGVVPGSWDDGLGLGEDPSQEDFGAHVFEVDDGSEFHADEIGSVGVDNHTSYYDQGNPALTNMADIVAGNGGEVEDVGGRSREAHDHLYDWAGDEVLHQAGALYEPVLSGGWPL